MQRVDIADVLPPPPRRSERPAQPGDDSRFGVGEPANNTYQRGRTCNYPRYCIPRAHTQLILRRAPFPVTPDLINHFPVTRRQLRTRLYKPRILCYSSVSFFSNKVQV